MHPPFFFVLPKKNAPCTVEEKGALSDQLDTCVKLTAGRESCETVRCELAGLCRMRRTLAEPAQPAAAC